MKRRCFHSPYTAALTKKTEKETYTLNEIPILSDNVLLLHGSIL